MRKLNHFILLLITVSLTSFAASGQSKKPSVADLSFLSGCWALAGGGSVSDEQWMKPSGGLMLGVGRTVKDGKATWFENMRLVEQDGTLFFVARPSSAKDDTFFKLKDSAAKQWTFENLENDFPNRVTYRNVSRGEMFARIEGKMDGKDAAQDFRFKRTNCE